MKNRFLGSRTPRSRRNNGRHSTTQSGPSPAEPEKPERPEQSEQPEQPGPAPSTPSTALLRDAELAAAIAAEERRQAEHVELIASENYVSADVLAAHGSVLTNKYADGYPGRRTYRGCEHVDVAERLAIERAKRLFGAAYANVQPYSGSIANMAAYFALLEPGDRVLAMSPAHGGHRTHGDRGNLSGRLYDVVHYGVDPATGLIDYDAVRDAARRHRPKLLVAGGSAYPRIVAWSALRQIADEVGARLMADMAHVAGLVAAGLHPNPVGIADVTTTTTHKTLRGPRGGMILAREDAELMRRLDEGVFPGTQGGPLMHVIAAKAVAFHEALDPSFRTYQEAVLANAKHMAERLAARGFDLVTGGTDTHMLLIALADGADETALEAALERANIAVNGVTLPPPAAGAPPRRGLRVGTPAVTTRGFGLPEIDTVSTWLAAVLDAPKSEPVLSRVRAEAIDLLRQFPIPATAALQPFRTVTPPRSPT